MVEVAHGEDFPHQVLLHCIHIGILHCRDLHGHLAVLLYPISKVHCAVVTLGEGETPNSKLSLNSALWLQF